MASTKRLSAGHLARAAAAVALCGAMAFVGCSGGGDDPAPAPKTTYTGTIYMASTGGAHIAVVPVTIDPSNAAAPIAVGAGLEMIPIGTKATHSFHDVRLDGTRLYYSTFGKDTTNTTSDTGHVGYVDLANGNALHDAVVDAQLGPAGTPQMIYCGSGQTSTHLVPMTMSHPAYIDAIAKSAVTDGATLDSAAGTDVKRTFVSAFRGTNADYIFAHGVNNLDGTELFVAVNETNAGAGGTPAGMSGAVTAYRLKMADVVAGTVNDSSSVLGSTTITGLSAGSATTAFRATYTPDGSKILQASKDRLIVLDATSLDVLDNNTAIGGSYVAIENHDAMPTPDGKYAILALRYKVTADAKMDSGLQLYDLVNKKAVGNPVSTCNACHGKYASGGVVPTDRATCGLDGSLTAVTQ